MTLGPVMQHVVTGTRVRRFGGIGFAVKVSKGTMCLVRGSASVWWAQECTKIDAAACFKLFFQS